MVLRKCMQVCRLLILQTPFTSAVVFGLFFLFLAKDLKALPSNNIPSVLSVERLTTDDGMASNFIMKCYRDKTGFMWFLTDRGLIKYNGYECITYANHPQDPNSLSYNELIALKEDDDGFLWIGSKEGLNRFNPKTGQFKRYFHDPNNPNSISNNYITGILKDRKGRYWIATEIGLNLFDPQRETFRSFIHDPSDPNSISGNKLNPLVMDPQGKIWIGHTANSPLECLDPDTFTFKQYKIMAPGGYPDVLSLAVDSAGMIWFGTWDHGLYRVNPADGSWKNYQNDPANPESLPSNIVHSILPDTDSGGLWIGTREGGLAYLDPKTDRFQRVKVVWKTDPNAIIGTITNVYRDTTGILWLSTMNEGVCRYDYNREQFIYIKNNPKDPNSLSENRVFALCSSRDGTVWIGTDGGGLNQYDPKTNRIIAKFINDPSDPASLGSNTVISIHEDAQGRLWAGCWGTENGAFSRFIPDTKSFKRYSHEPNREDGLHCMIARIIRSDYTGKIWIGTDGNGVNIFDPTAETFKHYEMNTPGARGLKDTYVRCFYEDHSKTFWVGTERTGLMRYDREQDQFTEFPLKSLNPNHFSTNLVLCIYEDMENALWLGTESGLIRINPERSSITRFTMEDGLGDNVVKGILEDDAGFLWLSLDNGKISRFHPQTKQFRNFDHSDGLQGLAFTSNSVTKGSDGGFYFGGINGLNCIWPGKLTQNTNIPPIVINSLEIMGKAHPVEPYISTGEEIKLDYRQNFLSFEFAALNYTHPYRNQYKYRLSPLETEWNDSGNRRYARYTAIEPGKYVFQVIGSNNDAIWNEKGASLSFYIKPPFWRTWWFKTGCITFFIIFPFLLYASRIRFLNTQKRHLEQEVEKRTKELYEANRTLDLLSKQDGLTKVANRRYFDEQLEMEWRRAQRNNSYLALIFIDVDLFKRFNDLYGHQAGDDCLKKIADIFSKHVKRSGDLAARYGGEEFVILLIDTDPSNAAHFAEQLRQEAEALQIPHENSDTAKVVTISLGVAARIPISGESPNYLIQAADQALYDSKRNGRNQVTSA